MWPRDQLATGRIGNSERCKNTEIQYDRIMDEVSDSAKDAVNLRKYGLSLAYGSRIFEDADHLIVSTIRKQDGEKRYKVIGIVGAKPYNGVFVWQAGSPRFMSVRRSNKNEERAYRA